MLTHIDLFSGIGGFSIACQWAGIRTEVFCERDEKCRRFLQRTYPGIPIFEDVRKFDGSLWRGRFILTAGVPCQPASRAGQQRGAADDRWLWGEALRVVSEARPDWCLFENPPGIDDVGLGGILTDLASIGYEVAPPITIPACAVNAPHIRQRVWIVANSKEQRLERWSDGRERKPEERVRFLSPGSGQGHLADTGSVRSNYPAYAPSSEQDGNGKDGGLHIGGDRVCRQWNQYVWTPCADGKFRRTPDDSFGLVDGLHRSVLAALGNSIVPQVAYQVIKAMELTVNIE
jgi:DNA (cytosine-5)-methyltransferase 1